MVEHAAYPASEGVSLALEENEVLSALLNFTASIFFSTFIFVRNQFSTFFISNLLSVKVRF